MTCYYKLWLIFSNDFLVNEMISDKIKVFFYYTWNLIYISWLEIMWIFHLLLLPLLFTVLHLLSYFSFTSLCYLFLSLTNSYFLSLTSFTYSISVTLYLSITCSLSHSTHAVSFSLCLCLSLFLMHSVFIRTHDINYSLTLSCSH